MLNAPIDLLPIEEIFYQLLALETKLQQSIAMTAVINTESLANFEEKIWLNYFSAIRGSLEEALFSVQEIRDLLEQQ